MKQKATKTSTAQNGNPLQPNEWVQRYGNLLYRYALARVRRGEVAEELVQETLLSAWRARKSFKEHASEKTWLIAILKRKIIDWIRVAVRSRSRTESQPDDRLDQMFHGGQWRNKPSEWEQGTPESGLQRAEFWNVVHGCTSKLPPRLREVFVLWHLDEQSSENVCESLDVTPSNLWVLLHRARLRLWGCLHRNWYGETTEDHESTGVT